MKGIVDTHCHILHGVDDGAATERDAMKMILLEREQGVRRIILTPHFRRGMFETDQRVIEEQFFRLCSLNRRLKTGVKLHLGCEFYRQSNMAEILLQGIKSTMAGSPYVLVEFSPRDDFASIRKTIYNLVMKGFKPIIAHGERYPGFIADLNQVDEVLRLGAYLQVTSGAIYGQHGFRLKRICKKLLAEDMIDFIGSDAHDLKKRAPDLDQCAKYLEKKKGMAYARRVLVHNPERMLEERIK